MARRAALTAGVIALATATAFGRALRYEFVWDDYTQLRPRGAAELLAAFHGTWDRAHVWPDYYRPLGLICYEAAYRLFGLNAPLQHAANLAGVAIVAALLSMFVWRELRSESIALFSAAAIIVHPESSAMGVWVSQQIHLVQLALVLAALLVWQRVRDRPAGAWWPLAAIVLVACLIKEDSVMLAPALLAMQLIRVRCVGDVPPPGWRRAAIVFAPVAMFLVARSLFVDVDRDAIPDAARLVRNLIRGPLYSMGLLWLPYWTIAGVTAAVLWIGSLAAGASAVRRHPRGAAASLFVSGLALLLLMDLPLALISGHSRVHLLTLAAVLTMTGGLGSLGAREPGSLGAREPGSLGAGELGRPHTSELPSFQATQLPSVRAIILLSTMMAAMVVADWRIQQDYGPCAAETLRTDEDVVEWRVVPEAIKQFLRDKPARCAAGAYRPMADAIDARTIVWPRP